jgi:hypothetical protein
VHLANSPDSTRPSLLRTCVLECCTRERAPTLTLGALMLGKDCAGTILSVLMSRILMEATAQLLASTTLRGDFGCLFQFTTRSRMVFWLWTTTLTKNGMHSASWVLPRTRSLLQRSDNFRMASELIKLSSTCGCLSRQYLNV